MKSSMSLASIFLVQAVPIAMLLLSSHFSIVQSDNNLIVQTCKNTPFYNLCITSLKSDPKSSQADVTGLALIMVSVVKARTTTALKVTKQQLRKSPGLKQPLVYCADCYSAILTADVPVAIEALQKGDPKFAEDGMNNAAIDVGSCEDGFHGKSPLTNFNKAVEQTSRVAAAIIRNLL